MKLIQKSKKEYTQRMIEQNQNTSQNMWTCINKLCGKVKSGTKITAVHRHNEIVTEKSDIVNEFNKFFSSLEAYAGKIEAPGDFNEHISQLDNTMFLYNTNEIEVQNMIKSLKNKKSPGIDGLRAETLKELSDLICKPLSTIINICFYKGYYPKCLKIGMIKPLFKSGSKLEVGNYRPISLISSVSKIIEKILKSRIVKFLNKYHVISDNQSALEKANQQKMLFVLLQKQFMRLLTQKHPL